MHVWKGNAGNSFTYYEDDGTSFDYEKGAFYKRIIRYLPDTRKLVFEPKEGSFTSKFTRIRVVLHGFDTLTGVTVNGKSSNLTSDKGKQVVELPNDKETITVTLGN